MDVKAPMIPRRLTSDECKMFSIKSGIITADDLGSRREYNCFGSAVGVRAYLPVYDGPSFMRAMVYCPRQREKLQHSDDVVALWSKLGFIDGRMQDSWHAAKRLRGSSLPKDLYESKFGMVRGSEPADWDPGLTGMRIVHPIDGIQAHYGKLQDTFWVRDTSPEAAEKRIDFLKSNYGIDNGGVSMDDSSALVANFLAGG